MAKRSITDTEIGLIKAMLARGMANDKVHFYFNRPDRLISSGRITQIKQRKYGGEVAAASDPDLDAFIAAAAEGGTAGGGAVSTPKTEELKGPLHPEVIAAHFTQDEGGTWRLGCGETDEHECKGNFGFKHWHEWMRAIAALANNRGGYIFFGVHDKHEPAVGEDDKSYSVIGLQSGEFAKADPSDFSKLTKSYLDPTPTVRTTTISIGSETIGVMYVEQHPGRPVIARSGDGKTIKEGDIFFRYPGRSERIKYSDLRAMLDARDASTRRDILPLVERLLALGPERALIADLDKGILNDGKRSIVIDPALLDQIKFIREGEFDEKVGAPALRLIGDVTADGKAVDSKIVRANITPDAVLRNFLTSEKVEQPLQYLANSANSNREWQPIWYYLHHANIPIDAAIEHLQKEVASHPSHRDGAIARLSGKRSAYNVNNGKPKQLIKEFGSGIIDEPTDDSEAHKFALAVQGLPDEQKNLENFPNILLKCYERATSQTSAHKNLKSAVFRAACRLDELLYRKESQAV
ncbi:ATP-binding protein [Oryzibacter oryziterrae]|uniref:ATP-binding protein n=1 Tax=Oryzibacter oryziterrae TaxID=2766474 RepID=UPI001F42A7B9|nr:ATP-binding protein [Oryzibacter oryziterrae]